MDLPPPEDLPHIPYEYATRFNYPGELRGGLSVKDGKGVRFDPDESEANNRTMNGYLTSAVVVDDEIEGLLSALESGVQCNEHKYLHRQPLMPLQLHMHCPSEHYINGTSYPMELHIVNLAQGGDL